MDLQGDNTVFNVHPCGQSCHIILVNVLNLQFNKTNTFEGRNVEVILRVRGNKTRIYIYRTL